jgi:DnaJ-domain-containing protein 1
VPMTESERHELYELARSQISDRFAELMMNALPPEPERLSTKDDLAVLGSDLRTEMADLRTELKTEMADLRTELKTEMADLRVEMRDLTNQQTRTLTLGLVGSITLLAITQMVLGVIG